MRRPGPLEELVREAFIFGLQWGFRLAVVAALVSVVVAALVVAGRLRLRVEAWPRRC